MYQNYMGERCVEIASYMLEHGDTVRTAAKHFHISKSTIHKDITEKLKYISPSLHSQICDLLAKNKAERHLRGGEATKKKFLKIQNKK